MFVIRTSFCNPNLASHHDDRRYRVNSVYTHAGDMCARQTGRDVHAHQHHHVYVRGGHDSTVNVWSSVRNTEVNEQLHAADITLSTLHPQLRLTQHFQTV